MSGVIAAAVGARAAGGFGIANQVTLLRAGLVYSIGAARRPVAPGVESGRAGGGAQPGCRTAGSRAGAAWLRGSARASISRSTSADPDPDRAGMAVGPGRRLDPGHRPGPLRLRPGGLAPAVPARPATPSRRRQAICVQQAHHCCSACCRRSEPPRRASARPWRLRDCWCRSAPTSFIWCAPGSARRRAVLLLRDPDRAILVIHTGKGVIRRCAAIVPRERRGRPRGDRA